MIRLEEVEAEIAAILRKTKRPQLAAAALARTLAAEVDDLRGKLDALRAEADPQALVICHMQGRAEGDDVITKLLDLTAPHVDEFGNRQWWQYKRPEQMHARACEIAGRTE